MKTCPWCGRKNLDSDDYCFNCERPLDAEPGEEEARELEEEIRRIHVYKPPSILKLTAISILRKAVFAILALGAFFCIALIAIWVSPDNSAVALAALCILVAAMLLAFYYPDVKLARKFGRRGIPVSLLSNIVLLGVALPPSLWFLSSRQYISGVWGFLARTWWGYAAFLVLGVILAWLAGRRTTAETAAP